jgi:hypothetical protein
MLLGLDAEFPTAESLRLLLHVVFQPIAIRRGHVAPCDYYVGTTGGTISVAVSNGEVIHHSASKAISVEYDENVARETSGARKFMPELKAKVGTRELEAKPGSLETGKKLSFSSGAKFTAEETLVAAVNLKDEVIWTIDSHRAEKAVRDFLVCDIDLDATFKWRSASKNGTVIARPSEIAFFDNSKRRLPNKAAILMRFLLWKKGIRIPHLDGITVSFVEETHERA